MVESVYVDSTVGRIPIKSRVAKRISVWYNVVVEMSSREQNEQTRGGFMDDLKVIISENITQLRKECGMTQADLAERLNYSDKAVSKWERAESLPDVTVLKKMADIFNVKVDYLLTADHRNEKERAIRVGKRQFRRRSIITGMCIMLVWLIATVVFFILDTATRMDRHWLCFVCAVPTSFAVWLIFNSVWFNRFRNFFIISLLMWTVLGTIFVFFIGLRMWLLFIVGVPAQVIICLWSGMYEKKK